MKLAVVIFPRSRAHTYHIGWVESNYKGTGSLCRPSRKTSTVFTRNLSVVSCRCCQHRLMLLEQKQDIALLPGPRMEENEK